MYRDRIFPSFVSRPFGVQISDLPVPFNTEPALEVLLPRILESKPKTIIEVGSWKGASAVMMSNACQAADLDTEIICIDTWLGSAEHWINREGVWGIDEMNILNGRPNLYDLFMTNIEAHDCEQFITPISLDADNAAILLRHHDVKAEVVYIDASHDYTSARRHIPLYWEFVKPGGIICGDDHDSDHPDVVRVLEEICREKFVTRSVLDNKWWIRKPNGG